MSNPDLPFYIGGRLPTHVEQIKIRHIAWHLSMTCRYLGGVYHFYSTAEHCIILSYLVPKELAFQALMHDASEAYCHDIVRHIKYADGMKWYRDFENKFYETLIAPRYFLPVTIDPVVKQMDTLVCQLERSSLRGGLLAGITRLGDDGEGGYHERVKDAFLGRFYELWPEHAGERYSIDLVEHL